jgi:adenylosuccinate synthase
MITDVCIDIVYGDCAKAKTAVSLLQKERYDFSYRWNGSQNAGGTWYHEGKKIVSRIVPAGIQYVKYGIIGPGCVVHVGDLFGEMAALKDICPDISNRVKIAYNTHIVTDAHRAEEANETKIGSTRKGVSPAYRDKYSRIGIQAKDIPELKDYIVDVRDIFRKDSDSKLLAIGAQGLGLDINWGDYPYVTSSHVDIGGLISGGVPRRSIRSVYAIAKAYTTYVGSKKFQPNDPVFDRIADAGSEYGSVTGRRRQCNFLDITQLKRNAEFCDITHLVINKIDVLRKVENAWKLVKQGDVLTFVDEPAFKQAIVDEFPDVEVSFSDNPYSL